MEKGKCKLKWDIKKNNNGLKLVNNNDWLEIKIMNDECIYLETVRGFLDISKKRNKFIEIKRKKTIAKEENWNQWNPISKREKKYLKSCFISAIEKLDEEIRTKRKHPKREDDRGKWKIKSIEIEREFLKNTYKIIKMEKSSYGVDYKVVG